MINSSQHLRTITALVNRIMKVTEQPDNTLATHTANLPPIHHTEKKD